MVRLTQMKWKGTVSHSAKTSIATRFRAAKTPQPTSSQAPLGSSLRRRSGGVDTVSLTPDGDDRLRAQLGPQATDVDVDDVRARVEVVAPYVRQQAFFGERLSGVLHELPQQEELALGQRDQAEPGLRRPPDQVQPQGAGLQGVRVP